MGSRPKAKYPKCRYRGQQTGIILVLLQLRIAFATSWSRMSEKRRIQDLRKFRVRHMALIDESMLGTRQRQHVSSPRVSLAGFKGP